MSKDCDVNHREVVCALIWCLNLDWGQEQYLVAKREMSVNGEPGLGGLYEFPRRKGKSIRSALFPLALYHHHDHPFHCRRSTICHCNHHPIFHRSPIVVACHQIKTCRLRTMRLSLPLWKGRYMRNSVQKLKWRDTLWTPTSSVTTRVRVSMALVEPSS